MGLQTRIKWKPRQKGSDAKANGDDAVLTCGFARTKTQSQTLGALSPLSETGRPFISGFWPVSGSRKRRRNSLEGWEAERRHFAAAANMSDVALNASFIPRGSDPALGTCQCIIALFARAISRTVGDRQGRTLPVE